MAYLNFILEFVGQEPKSLQQGLTLGTLSSLDTHAKHSGAEKGSVSLKDTPYSRMNEILSQNNKIKWKLIEQPSHEHHCGLAFVVKQVYSEHVLSKIKKQDVMGHRLPDSEAIYNIN